GIECHPPGIDEVRVVVRGGDEAVGNQVVLLIERSRCHGCRSSHEGQRDEKGRADMVGTDPNCSHGRLLWECDDEAAAAGPGEHNRGTVYSRSSPKVHGTKPATTS